jgi:dienelactone hydrolase
MRSIAWENGVLLDRIRLLAPAIALALLIVAAPGPALAADPPTAAAPGSAARLTSDQVADSLFGALRSGDYDAAFRLFDARMKAAVPLEKLRTLWEEQTGRIGALRSWERIAGDPSRGYEVRLATLRFDRGEMKAMVAVDPLEGSVAGFFLRPAAQPAAGHPAYADTTRFHTVDVTVGSDPYPLPGSLALPAGTGPFPAVVLVHGSGPQDRDETIGANKVFRDIAEGLASKGIVVLRYDKRSLRYPEALKDKPTIDDEVVLDAMAAVKLVQGRAEVDPKRVLVIGHSLGALLAPEIALRAGSVAGTVLLAPPGRKPWNIVAAQMRYLNAPAAEIEKIDSMGKTIESGKITGDPLFAGAPVSYWIDWGKRDGPETARKLARPLLVLHGERDYQVIDEDVAIWKKRLQGAPNTRFVSLPGLNHLFIEGTGKPGPAEYDTPGHVDARVIEALAAFAAAPAAAH